MLHPPCFHSGQGAASMCGDNELASTERAGKCTDVYVGFVVASVLRTSFFDFCGLLVLGVNMRNSLLMRSFSGHRKMKIKKVCKKGKFNCYDFANINLKLKLLQECIDNLFLGNKTGCIGLHIAGMSIFRFSAEFRFFSGFPLF